MEPIIPEAIIRVTNYIFQSEANATPSEDIGKIVKLEGDGHLHPYFTKNGAILAAGETLSGATLPVPVYQNKTDNELYACDANDTGKLKFIGFAISTATDGNPLAFQGSGVVGGFSGLSEGEKYYLQDAAGTIGTTPGTYPILVGVAISETQLLIQKASLRRHGTVSFSDAGNVGEQQTSAITLGFRPSVIRLTAVSNNGAETTAAISVGSWINGTYAVAYIAPSNGSSSGGTSTSKAAVINAGGTAMWSVVIIDVTDTGFTIQVQQENNSPNTLGIAWEAEGDL